MTTVEQIHNEFYTAGENAVSEAKKIVNAPIQDNKKRAERLKRIGFSQSKDCKEAEAGDFKRQQARDLIQNFEYWQRYYPGNKFITADSVKQICDKYGLMLGGASGFYGDIPEKNLLEIEAFKLREEDFFQEFTWSTYESMIMRLAMGESNAGFKRGGTPKFEKPAFRICAPQSDFDMRGMEVREGHILVYDPVVLQPVKDGYLIVTAWGSEASDPLVTNETMN